MLPQALHGVGVRVQQGFLDEELRGRLLEQAKVAPHVPLRIERTGVGWVTDEDVRKSTRVEIKQTLANEVDQRIEALRGELPAQWLPGDAVRLPFLKFLCYRPGDFFVPHSDERPTPFGPNRSRIGHRKTVVVVGLSDPADYEGGELELFVPAPSGHQGDGAAAGITIKVPAGGAISYPAHLVHGVRPVTQGERYVATASFGYITEAVHTRPESWKETAEMLTASTTVRRSADAIGTQVDQDFVLMAPDLTYHGLDKVGSMVWELLAAPSTIDELAQRIGEAYSVPAEQVRDDLLPFMQTMVSKGLVTAG